MKREPDIVVISDVHLGTYGCHARELLQYLKSVRPKTLIINGDFIDIWQFRKRYFPKEHMQVIQRILKMAARGTKVYYITGNHDDLLRRYSDFSTGNIHLRDKLILQLKGKRVWIFHGDIFDLAVPHSPCLAKLGGKSYDYLIVRNRCVNKLRGALGFEPMSLAGQLKQRVKRAVRFIGDFEQTAIQLAGEQKYDVVICGHIHLPQMRKTQSSGHPVTYLNAGDWVENLTALEYQWGQWSIYKYDEADYQKINNRLVVKEIHDALKEEEEEDLLDDKKLETEALVRSIIGITS